MYSLCGGARLRSYRFLDVFMEFKAMRKITTLAVVAALLASFASEAGARTIAPPGNSEADQYYETLPGSSGPRAPHPPKTVEETVEEGGVDTAADSALRRRGEVGVAAADAIARTAPTSGQGRGDGGSPGAAAATPDEQGLGGLFLPILAITAAAAAVFFLARRRRTATR